MPWLLRHCPLYWGQASYFKGSDLVKTADLDPSKRYVFAGGCRAGQGGAPTVPPTSRWSAGSLHGWLVTPAGIWTPAHGEGKAGLELQPQRHAINRTHPLFLQATRTASWATHSS